MLVTFSAKCNNNVNISTTTTTTTLQPKLYSRLFMFFSRRIIRYRPWSIRWFVERLFHMQLNMCCAYVSLYFRNFVNKMQCSQLFDSLDKQILPPKHVFLHWIFTACKVNRQKSVCCFEPIIPKGIFYLARIFFLFTCLSSLEWVFGPKFKWPIPIERTRRLSHFCFHLLLVLVAVVHVRNFSRRIEWKLYLCRCGVFVCVCVYWTNRV